MAYTNWKSDITGAGAVHVNATDSFGMLLAWVRDASCSNS